MNPGDTVRWIDKDKRSHFVRLVSTGRKWARVDGSGVPKEVLLADITPWPPERAAHDTTAPPQRRAKRKGRG